MIRPKDIGLGDFTVSALNAREALKLVGAMIDHGKETVDVFDAEGRNYNLSELERLASGAEKNASN